MSQDFTFPWGSSLPPIRLPFSPPPSPLRRDQSLAYAIHRVYCHLPAVGRGRGHTAKPHHRRGGTGPPSTPTRFTRRARSSLAAATLLGLSLGALATFAHTVLGAFLALRRAAGAAACRPDRECPVPQPLPASVSTKKEGGKEGCQGPRRCPLPGLTRSLTQHLWHYRGGGVPSRSPTAPCVGAGESWRWGEG